MTTETLTQEAYNESPFFVVRTVREASETFTNAVNEYNDKYVRKAVEKGKEFKEGLRKDASLLVDRLVAKKGSAEVDETSDQPADAESEFYLVRTAREAADAFTSTVREYNDKYVGKAVERGKEFTEGLQKDARILADRFVEKGKALLPELPVKGVEEKITHGVKTVVEKMDLPSKEDIESLNETMDALNTRVDALKRDA